MKPISYEYLHPTEHRMAHARKKYPLQKARQKGTKCGPKSHNLQYRPTIMSKLPSQTIPTRSIQWPQAENNLVALGPSDQNGPGPKLNLVTRWRDDVNLSMWKINIPNSPEWPTPEKSTCCKLAPQKGTKCGPKAHNA